MLLSINWVNYLLIFDSIIIIENMNIDNIVEKILSNSCKYKWIFLNIYKFIMLFLRWDILICVCFWLIVWFEGRRIL